MSGYLQRLAANARKPSASIHPVVGSRFTAPKFGDAPETLPGEEEMVVSTSHSQPVVTPPSAVPRSPGLPLMPAPPLISPLISFSANPRQDSQSSPVADAGDLPKPLLERPEERVTPAAASVRTYGVPDPTEGLLDSSRENETTNPSEPRHAAARERHEILQYSYRPLVAEDLHPATGPRISTTTPAASLNERTRQVDSSRRIAPPVREPDQIEIHIGRIEVTAVPQPQARPAAPAPRKSLNLDEYLKRQNRRA
jgi:hypothetical protein